MIMVMVNGHAHYHQHRTHGVRTHIQDSRCFSGQSTVLPLEILFQRLGMGSELYKMWGLDGHMSAMFGMPPQVDSGEQLLVKFRR